MKKKEKGKVQQCLKKEENKKSRRKMKHKTISEDVATSCSNVTTTNLS
jgi:hypothetical protein